MLRSRFTLEVARQWWAVRWKATLAVAALSVSVLGAAAAVALLASDEQGRRATEADRERAQLVLQAERRRAFGEAVLDNCLRLEVVTSAVRQTIQAGLNQQLQTSYYKTRPKELAAAQRSQHEALARFGATDCYRLPAVVIAGVLPPSPQPAARMNP